MLFSYCSWFRDRTFTFDCRMMNSVPSFGRKFSRRKPVGQNGVLTMIDAKGLVFNAVKPPNVQANPLPDHGPAPGPSINMITICTSGEGEGEQGCSSPFVIEYIPAEAAVGLAGIDAPPAPLVINIPAREPYSNCKVPWTYEGGVGSLEQQFD
ncbi:hypothetical protein CRG98_048130, partial [Punica granatum]